MKKLLIIDIGSNSVKCSAYSCENKYKNKNKSKSKIISREWHETRILGLIGKIKDGIMSAEGEELLCRTLKDYSIRAKKDGINEIFAFATASLRALGSPDEFIARVFERTGIMIKLLSGEEEAAYSFEGIKRKLGADGENGVAADMGGGSTEVIEYENGKIKSAVSLPFGAMVLKNKFVRSDIPTKDEVREIEKYAKKEFSAVAHQAEKIVLVGGTAKCFGALAGKDSVEMSVSDFDTTLSKLIEDGAFQQKARELFPERFPLILPGAIALRELVRACSSELILTTVGGLRDGIACEIFAKSGEKGSLS